MIKNFLHASNRLFKSKFPPKHNRNISSLGKLSYGDLFIPITLFISESPHLTGFFKLRADGRNVGSCWPTMLLQQCCVRLHVASKALKCSNKRVNIGAMTSIILERDVHGERNTDQHFDTKVNAWQVGPQFGSNSPLYGKMPGVCLGSGRFWNWLVNNLTLVRSLVPSLAQAS